MLRLRLTESIKNDIHSQDSVGVTISSTNESGSVTRLAEACKGTATLRSPSGAVLSASDAVLTIGSKFELSMTGVTVVNVTVETRSAAPFVDVRILLCTTQTHAAIVHASARSGAGKAGWVPSTRVPVGAIMTPVIRVRRAAAAAGALQALRGEDPSADSCMVSFPLLIPVQRGQVGTTVQLHVYEKHNSISPGFGSIVWDCALAVLKAMPAGVPPPGKGRIGLLPGRPSGWSGLRVVDLGCGTGLLGIAAAALGATVALTDLPIMLPLACANARANEAAILANGGCCATLPLEWGSEAVSMTNGCATSIRIEALEWPACIVGKHGHGGPATFGPTLLQCPVDVVLASEVAYRPEAFKPLLATLIALTACDINKAHIDVRVELASGPSSGCPIILLAARRRACCDLSDFLSLVRAHFWVHPIAGMGVEWCGSEEQWAGLTGTTNSGEYGLGSVSGAELSSVLSPAAAPSPSGPPAGASTPQSPLDEFVGTACLLSKTGWGPMLFQAWPKRWKPQRHQAS